MNQRSLDFENDESNRFFRMLDPDQQQSLIDLMAALITHVFHERENIHHDQLQQSSQD